MKTTNHVPRILFVFALTMALFSSAIRTFADTVTLHDNGNGTVTMSNSLVSMTFSKTGGDVSSVIAAGMPGVNLIDSSHDFGLKLSHIGSGTNDYWCTINSPNNPNYVVVTNTGQIVDVMLDNPTASGDAGLFPNGIWDWQIHHVMRAGESGFYTYHVWRHTANQPAAYYTADSWQGTTAAMFACSTNSNGSTIDAWGFSASDVPAVLNIGAEPPGGNSKGVPGEDEILPYTNYWTQRTSGYYEPGWPIYTQPCGLTSDLHPVWTKYDYSSYEGPSNTYRNTWGTATDQAGIWTILGSFEFINGGPTKLKGGMSGNYIYNDDVEGHGLGAGVDNPGVAAGAVWSKMVGPFFMYVNTGTNHMQLWQDATNMGAQMVSNWPYAWVNETEQVYPRHRGTVTGTIKAETGESTANAVVILGDSTYTNWMWQGATNFLFWTTADSNGNFSIPKVRPDKYMLFSYVPGIWGELQVSNIVVTADQTNNLGVVSWNPPHLQQRLWRVGSPDHTSKEFRFGNLAKQYGLWWRYLTEKGTNDVNFTIGKSVESNDWYYAQCEMLITPQSGTNLTDHTQTNFSAIYPVWNVIFNLTNLPPTNVLCTVALAGCNGCYFYPYINGVNRTPNISGFSDPSKGVYTTSGDDVYRDVVQVGRYQYYQFSFPSSDFVVGTNTFSIHIRQPGNSGTYTITNVDEGYPDLLIGGLIYDFVQMETGPQVSSQTPAPPTGLGATPGNNQVALSWNSSSGATCYNVKRSTTSGSGYATIASHVTTISYTDTTAVNGTTYYYVVSAVNSSGESANSSQVSATPEPPAPPTPTGLAATPGNNQVALTWNTSSGATSYNVKRSTTSGSGYATIASPTTTSYTDTTAANGTTYYYVVSAVNTGGESANSSQVSATPSGGGGSGFTSPIVLVNPGFETNTSGVVFTSKVSTGFDVSGNDVAGWLNAGSTYASSGVDYAGDSGVVVHGGSVTAYCDQGDSGAYQITGYPMQAGDQLTLTWWAKSSYNNAAQSVSLLSGASPSSAFSSLTTLATSTAALNNTGNGGAYTQYTLTYTAGAADAGKYVAVSFLAPGTAGSWAMFDDFALSVTSLLPSPWASGDIGAVGVAGSASASTNGLLFTVAGSGADIWGAGDQLRYVYQPASGDCSVQAEVLSVQNTQSHAKGGVMIRETLNTNSAMAMVDLTPSAGVEFVWRTNTAASAASTVVAGITAPNWVKVTRTGNSFVGYYSTNGTAWTVLGTNTITMGTGVYVGLPVCAHNNTVTCTATFTNVVAAP
jgi:hypothetical protein